MRMFCSGLAGAGILTGLLLSLSCSLTGWKFTGSNVDSVLGRRTGAGLTGLRGPTRDTKLFRGKTWETSASVVSAGASVEITVVSAISVVTSVLSVDVSKVVVVVVVSVASVVSVVSVVSEVSVGVWVGVGDGAALSEVDPWN